MVEFSAYVEHQRDPDTYNKHLFVHIGGPVTYSDPLLEVRVPVIQYVSLFAISWALLRSFP
jgi:hypothetical protein